MLRILGGLFLVVAATAGCGAYMPSNTSQGDMGVAATDLGVITDQAVFSGPDMVTTLPVPAGCNTTTVVSGTTAYKTLTNGVTGNGMRCMGGACHNTTITPKFNSQATFMALMINQRSTAGVPYITPNDPNSSYVLYKLAGQQTLFRDGGGMQMPRGGTPLTAAEQCVIYDWILHGAPTN